ncbi:hypothetical protein CDAR_174491 [Caerostris darwini]|uniref:Uncharacterized protein n=1 Tax=Caerostris darwini TaxID=1538125 RepID=A0AAV4PFK2_9ARAC|nr:hypothetical protein CDAR_174491 [Caerostris darwini]
MNHLRRPISWARRIREKIQCEVSDKISSGTNLLTRFRQGGTNEGALFFLAVFHYPIKGRERAFVFACSIPSSGMNPRNEWTLGDRNDGILLPFVITSVYGPHFLGFRKHFSVWVSASTNGNL